jgi:hypothetical protein
MHGTFPDLSSKSFRGRGGAFGLISARPSHPMWGSVGFSSSLSMGMLVPKAVGFPRWRRFGSPSPAYSSHAREGERSLNPDMRSPRAPGSGPFHQDVLHHALLDGPCPMWLPPRKVSSSIVWFPGASRVMWPVIPRIFSG